MLATELLGQSISVLFRGNLPYRLPGCYLPVIFVQFCFHMPIWKLSFKKVYSVVETSTLNVMNWVWNRFLVILRRYLGQMSPFIKRRVISSSAFFLASLQALYNLYWCSLYIHYLEFFKWSSHVFSLFYALPSLSLWFFKDLYKMCY